FNVQVGALPTLVGAEYTFSFQNMNVERGLLWNQENAVNRGIQLNETYKKLTASLSWNDGFYSNRYTWLSGSLAYAFNSSNSLVFVGAGNAGAYAKNTLATPLYLNNSQIYNIIYNYGYADLSQRRVFSSRGPRHCSRDQLHAGCGFWPGWSEGKSTARRS